METIELDILKIRQPSTPVLELVDPWKRKRVKRSEVRSPVIDRRRTEMYHKWFGAGDVAASFMEIAGNPGGFGALENGYANFSVLMEPLRTLFHGASVLIRKGRSSDGKGESRAAESLDKCVRQLCYVLMGDWFPDWMRARSVFLLNFRELLAKHEGNYVLIGPHAETGEWDILEVKASAQEAERAAIERGLDPRKVLIDRVVKGAEKIPTLDLTRPESIGLTSSDEGRTSSAGCEGDEQ